MISKQRVSQCNDLKNKESGCIDNCSHEYVFCENIFPLAVCCKKCSHMLVKSSDGTVSESYVPVHL